MRRGGVRWGYSTHTGEHILQTEHILVGGGLDGDIAHTHSKCGSL
jgi:hypothetical protein